MRGRGKTTAFLVAKVSRRGEEDAARMACPRRLLAHGHGSGTTKKPRQCRGFLRPYGRAFPPASVFCAAVAALSGSLLRPEAAITGQLASPPGTALCRPSNTRRPDRRRAGPSRPGARRSAGRCGWRPHGPWHRYSPPPGARGARAGPARRPRRQGCGLPA